MSAFYDEMQAVALELLAEFGRDITIKRYTFAKDLTLGASVKTLSAQQTLKGAVLPASGGTVEAFDIRFFDNATLANKNLRFVIFSAKDSTFVPGPMDEATFDGVDWKMLGCTPLNVEGTPILFNVGFSD